MRSRFSCRTRARAVVIEMTIDAMTAASPKRPASTSRTITPIATGVERATMSSLLKIDRSFNPENTGPIAAAHSRGRHRQRLARTRAQHHPIFQGPMAGEFRA